MLGIEPRASHMRSERSTTELHPHAINFSSLFFSLCDKIWLKKICTFSTFSFQVMIYPHMSYRKTYRCGYIHPKLIFSKRNGNFELSSKIFLCKILAARLNKKKFSERHKLEVLGIEPRAFHMQSERSTTELHPRHLSM